MKYFIIALTLGLLSFSAFASECLDYSGKFITVLEHQSTEAEEVDIIQDGCVSINFGRWTDGAYKKVPLDGKFYGTEVTGYYGQDGVVYDRSFIDPETKIIIQQSYLENTSGEKSHFTEVHHILTRTAYGNKKKIDSIVYNITATGKSPYFSFSRVQK